MGYGPLLLAPSRGDLGALHPLSTVQYNIVQYSTVQYSTVQYSTVQYSTVQYSTVQYSTVLYSTVQYSTVKYSTVCLFVYYSLEFSENWLYSEKHSRFTVKHSA